MKAHKKPDDDRALNTLPALEKGLRRMLDSLPVMVCAVDASGTIAFWNGECERVTGYRADEIIGNTASMKVLFPNAARRRNALAQWRKGADGRHNWRSTLTAKDGGQRLVAWSSISGRFPVPGGARWAFGIDITDRRRARAALQAAQEAKAKAEARAARLTRANRKLRAEAAERLRAGETIERARRQLEDVIDNASSVVALKDPDGHYIFVNHRGAWLCHRTKEEFVGKTDYEIFPKETADAFRAAELKALESKTPVETENTVMHDGAPYTYLTVKFALRNAAGKPYAIGSVATDITNRKQAEGHLRLLSSVVEQSTEGIAAIDFQGNLLFVNEAFAQVHGYTSQELLGKHLSVLHTPEQVPDVDAANRRVRETGTFTGEIWHVRKDGTVFPAAVHNALLRGESGRVIGITSTLRDITARKAAEQRLLESEEKYRDLVENANSVILKLDREGRITFFNEFAQKLLGYKEEEIVGRSSIGTIVPETDTSGRDLRPLVRDILAHPERYETHENENITRDGRRVWVAWTNKAVRDTDGNVVGLLSIGNDVTERKRVEDALQYRADFEKLIASLSSDFIGLSPGRIDDGINHALQAIGEFSGVDRAYVFLRSDDGGTASNTHEWCRPGVEPHKQWLQRLPVDAFPWMKSKLERLEAVHIPRLADLPREAIAVRAQLETIGTKSCICVPMASGAVLLGFLGFAADRVEKTWDEDTIALLRFVGEIFVSAIQRKRAEEAVQASEENYRQLFDYHPAACFAYDRDGVIRMWNREAKRLYGYDAKEVIGRTISETISSGEANRVATDELIARVFRGESVSGLEWMDHTADGELRWVFTNTFPVRNRHGRVVLGISSNIDITQRKQAEEAIRVIVEGTARVTGADFFRSLVRQLAGALNVRFGFVGELVSERADTVRTLAVWAGDRFEDNVEYPLAGTPCENVVGQTIRHYPSNARERFPKDPLLVELGVESYMGVPLYGSAGQPLGLLAVMHDQPMAEAPNAESILTIFAARAGAELERKRADEALEESEARFRTVTESSLTGVYIFREGRFQYVNPAFAETFGYPRDEIIRKMSPVDLVHPDDRDMVMDRIRRRLEGQVEATHYVFRGLRKDGAIIQCEAMGRRIDYKGGPVIIGTLLDVTERQRVEEALRDSEARTRAIVNTAADAIVTADERGVIQSFNPAAARMFGYSPEEAVGQNLAILMPEPYASEHNRYLENYRKTGMAKIIGIGREIVARRKDGTVFPIDLSVAEVRIGEQHLFTGIIRDITERKRAENALRDERNLVTAILDTAGALVLTLDTHGRIVRFNRACENLTGYSFAEVQGRHLWEFLLLPEEINDVRGVFEDLREGQFPSRHENYWVARDGTRRLIDWSNTALLGPDGRPEHIIATGIDITDRKQAEQALRESEERHRTILDHMQEAVIFADSHDIIRHINAFACELLNTTREQVVGRELLPVHPEEVRPRVAQIVRAFRERRGRNVITSRRPLGEREVIFRFSPVHGPDGQYWGIITNIIDITEQVRMQQRLAEARRMETVGTLAGGVAHDFNNLMATVLGSASHLKAKRRPDHPDYESLVHIEQAADTAGRLAHQLLVYAKGGKILPRLVDFRDVLGRALKVFKPTLPATVHLDCQIAHDLAKVECDTTQVEQVIVNLCRNAVDAMPNGGTLTVRATNETLDSPVEDAQPPLPRGDYVNVTVEDTGYGMDPETAKRVFDPFFTTKANGYGMGLAAAYGTVRGHGGAIALTTAPGKGTTFRVWLPQTKTEESSAAGMPNVDSAQ